MRHEVLTIVANSGVTALESNAQRELRLRVGQLNKMARRTFAQRTGSAAENLVFKIFDGHPNWVARNQDRDFGVDLEVELANEVPDGQELIGRLLKVQIKGSQELEVKSQHVALKLRRDYIDYINQFRVPVILVAVDVPSDRVWYLWLQEWSLNNEVRLKKETKNVTIHIPIEQTLEAGLERELVSVARGETNTTMVLALRDLVSAASQLNNHRILSSSFEMLKQVDDPKRTWGIDVFIDAFTNQKYPPWDFDAFPRQICMMIQRLGDMLTANDVKSLTVKGEDEIYIRGINFLQALYDFWSEHAISLRLPEMYESMNFLGLEWYCRLREHYRGELGHVVRWKFIRDPTTESRFGSLKLSKNHDLMEHEHTRGDGVYFTYLRAQ